MTKFIPFLLYFWLIAMHQVFLADVTSIFGAKINLAVLIVLLIAMYKTEIAATWFGLFVGLIGFAGITEISAWQTLAMALIGLIAFHLKEKMNLDSLFARVSLIFGGTFVHNIVLLLLELNDNLFISILEYALTGAIYTTIIGTIFFLIKDGIFTFEKTKTVF